MAIDVLDSPPAEFRAGDTVLFTRAGGDYPASTWPERKIVFRKGFIRNAIDGAINGDDFDFTIASDAAKDWEPGQYAWAEFAQDADGRRVEIASGSSYIGENLIDGSPKSHARSVLENLQAKLLGRTLPNADIESSNINGQQIQRMSTEQIMRVMTFYEAKVIGEDRRAMQFGRPVYRRGSAIKLSA